MSAEIGGNTMVWQQNWVKALVQVRNDCRHFLADFFLRLSVDAFPLLFTCSRIMPDNNPRFPSILDSMKKVMLGDRLFGRVRQAKFVVLDNTSRENELRDRNWERHLKTAYDTNLKLK